TDAGSLPVAEFGKDRHTLIVVADFFGRRVLVWAVRGGLTGAKRFASVRADARGVVATLRVRWTLDSSAGRIVGRHLAVAARRALRARSGTGLIAADSRYTVRG